MRGDPREYQPRKGGEAASAGCANEDAAATAGQTWASLPLRRASESPHLWGEGAKPLLGYEYVHNFLEVGFMLLITTNT